MPLSELIERVNRNRGGLIIRKQTTYVDIGIGSETLRITYHRKREFSFVSDGFEQISLHAQHPLLMDYVEPMVPVHLASHVIDKAKFRKLLEDAAAEVFGNWRSLDRYLNMPLEEFLEKPYGLLMTAPDTFARLATKRADNLGIRLLVHKGRIDGGCPTVLVMDENFVVADGFRVELLQKAENI